MANAAETLRAIGQGYTANADDGCDCEDCVQNRGDATSCESGARAWEMVQRFAERDPIARIAGWDPMCIWCGEYESVGHVRDCLWQQARSLVTGQEER